MPKDSNAYLKSNMHAIKVKFMPIKLECMPEKEKCTHVILYPPYKI
jgi:hypothetical protein